MALKEYLAAFGIDVDDAALDTLQSKIGFLKKNVAEFATVAAAGFVIKGALDLAGEVAELGDEIGDTATKLQVGTDSLQEWRYVLQLSGADATAYDAAIRKMNLSSAQAAEGSKEAAAAYADAGVELRDANGQIRASEDLFEDAIINLSQMEDTAKRNAAASKIFGRNYSELLGVLDKGADGVAELRRQFRDSGGLFSAEDLEKAGKYDDVVNRFDATLRGLKITVGTVLLPAMTWFGVKISELVGWFNRLVKGTSLVQAALVVVGAVGAKALLGLAVAARGLLATLAPFALQALIFAGIFLVVEDLITLFRGGESAIGDFIDGLFGDGTTQRIVDNVTEIGETTLATIEDIGSDVVELGEDIAELWDKYAEPAFVAMQIALVAVGLKFAAAGLAATTAGAGAATTWGVGVVAAVASAGAAAVSAGVAAIAAWLPFIATAAVIVAAIYGIIYVWQNWETIVSNFAFFFQDVWGQIVAWWNGTSWAEKFVGAWDFLKNYYLGIFNWFIDKFQTLMGWGGKIAGVLGLGSEGTPEPPSLGGGSIPSRPGGGAAQVTNNVPVQVNLNQTIEGTGSPEAVAARANRGVGAAAKEGASRAALNALVPVKGG